MESTKKPLIVNLFGPPGAGKSTGAAYIFSQLKLRGINAEYVTEFAKDKTWEHNKAALGDQLYMFGKQHFRISRCADQVDIIITDSPLFLNVLYNSNEVLGEDFNKLVLKVFNSYNNLNYFIKRVKPYNPKGRNQTEDESKRLGMHLKDLLVKYNINAKIVRGEIEGYNLILEEILNNLGVNNA